MQSYFLQICRGMALEICLKMTTSNDDILLCFHCVNKLLRDLYIAVAFVVAAACLLSKGFFLLFFFADSSEADTNLQTLFCLFPY